MRPLNTVLLPGAVLLVFALIAQITGLTLRLGAHPWWAQKVIWIGLPLGIGLAILAGALGIPRLPRQGGFALLTLAAFLTAHLGKSRFAASFAEDTLAGQAWYFGWIATCAFAAATLASLFRYSRQTH